MRQLAVLVFLLAAPALAEEPVQAYLRAANKLYMQLEYEKALEQLQRAKKVSRGLDDDVTIALWEGVVSSDLGRNDDARAAFNTALALKADAALPVKVSPKVAAVFEKLRADAQKELAKNPPPQPPEKPAPEEPPPPPPPAVAAPEPVPPPVVPVVTSTGGGVRRASVVPFVLGGAGAVVGIVGGVVASGAASRLQTERFANPADAMAVRDNGALFQLVGFTGLGIGVAGLLTGTLMALLGGPTQVALVPRADGLALSFLLELP